MAEFAIRRAQRSHAKARVGLTGPSGAGKTMGALLLARGIVEYMLELGVISGTIEGKVGVVDTERRSGSLYAHLFPYDVIDLEPPYTVARYTKAVRALERSGCAVVIVDQISHAWVGQGGILDIVDDLKRRSSSGNQFDAWREATPEQNEFVEMLLGTQAHLICNMRAKTAYVMEEKFRRDGTKTTAPKKIGMAPVQRQGIEYEFTVMLDLEVGTHLFTSSKDRTSLFDGQSGRLNEEWGRKLAFWLYSGQAADAAPEALPTERAEAIAGAAQRMIERAGNVPDLERIYANAVKDLRGFLSTVDEAKLIKLREDLIEAAKRRKAAMGKGEPAAGPVIDPGAAVDLEQLLQDAGIPLAECAEKFSVQRLVMIPADKLQEVVDWIAGEALERGAPPIALTKRLQDMGAVVTAKTRGKFDDLEDDLPWKDD